MDEFSNACEQAARAGGQVLRDWLGRIRAREKGPKDLVTEADLASQQAIRELLLGRFPDHQFLGEEIDSSDARTLGEGYCWVVDPLDGTTNYVHQLPNFAVSIALCRGGQALVGTVYDPLLDECFSAVAGRGARLNGKPIRVSDCCELRQALIAASFSSNVRRDSPEVRRFLEVLYASQAVRRMGSAALNLCYVGAGRLDGYWATSVQPWDVAAGTLIVREAQGVLSAPDGTPFELPRATLAAAATPELHRALLALLA